MWWPPPLPDGFGRGSYQRTRRRCDDRGHQVRLDRLAHLLMDHAGICSRDWRSKAVSWRGAKAGRVLRAFSAGGRAAVRTAIGVLGRRRAGDRRHRHTEEREPGDQQNGETASQIALRKATAPVPLDWDHWIEPDVQRLREPGSNRFRTRSHYRRWPAVASAWNSPIALHTSRPMPRAICCISSMLCARKTCTDWLVGSACHQLP